MTSSFIFLQNKKPVPGAGFIHFLECRAGCQWSMGERSGVAQISISLPSHWNNWFWGYCLALSIAFNPIGISASDGVAWEPCPFCSLSCRMLPRDCQMLLFSATFEDSVWKFAQKVVPDPNIIKLKREEETLDTIKQYYVLCNNRDEKFQALCNIYGAITIAQAMIFCHVSPFGER